MQSMAWTDRGGERREERQQSRRQEDMKGRGSLRKHFKFRGAPATCGIIVQAIKDENGHLVHGNFGQHWTQGRGCMAHWFRSRKSSQI